LKERKEERKNRKKLNKEKHSGLLSCKTNLKKPASFRHFWRKAAFNLTYIPLC